MRPWLIRLESYFWEEILDTADNAKRFGRRAAYLIKPGEMLLWDMTLFAQLMTALECIFSSL
nr:Hypothetical protein SCATT_36290 [uncultured bacterium]